MQTIQELRARRASGEDITDELLNQLEELTERMDDMRHSFNYNMRIIQEHDHRVREGADSTDNFNSRLSEV